MTAKKPGQQKVIVWVEHAECPRGGRHVERMDYRGRLVCLKCGRSSAEIDLELNGPGNDRGAR